MKHILFIFFVLAGSFSFSQTTLDTPTWKIGYSNLPFWDSTIKRNCCDSYIDTFSVDTNHFRIIYDEKDSANNAVVEKFKTKKWDTVTVFENMGNHNGYTRDEDFDNDGYKDLEGYTKWNMDVLLYNPLTGNFDGIGFSLNDYALVDKERNIFFNATDYPQLETNDSSELFTLKNHNTYVLLTAKLIFGNKKEDKIKTKKVIVYNQQNVKIKEILINSYHFEFEKFWNANYKNLLGYR